MELYLDRAFLNLFDSQSMLDGSGFWPAGKDQQHRLPAERPFRRDAVVLKTGPSPLLPFPPAVNTVLPSTGSRLFAKERIFMQTDHSEVYASVARPWLAFYDEKFIDQPMPACTVFEFVCKQNRRNLNSPALEYYGRTITYADLIVNVKKTAAALRAIGVKKGEIITVVSVMTPEVIYCFYAADMLGATLNLVDPRYSADGICDYIKEVDSRLLICLNVAYDRCRQAARRTNVEKVLVISPADSLPLPLSIVYKLSNPDKNQYASNVVMWKDFMAAGQGHSPTTHSTPALWCTPAALPAPPRALCSATTTSTPLPSSSSPVKRCSGAARSY